MTVRVEICRPSFNQNFGLQIIFKGVRSLREKNAFDKWSIIISLNRTERKKSDIIISVR